MAAPVKAIARRGIQGTRITLNKSLLRQTVKRGLDLCLATVSLVVLAPIFLLVAMLVRSSDSGPVFFGHQRIGYRGQPFRCLKFRTMAVDGDRLLERHLSENPQARREWQVTQKLRDDPRVTSVGRVLRRTSLDELPQLINVLRGEMSLVGPRPIVEGELRKYGPAAADYLSVRPGLTGLWQVSGRSETSYEYRVRLDQEYVRNQSLITDLRIMLRTVPVVLSRKGSC